MPDLVSRQELRLRVRRRVDMVGDFFVSEDELDSYVQKSFEKLYNYLASKYESYFVAFATERDIYSYAVNPTIETPKPEFGLLAGQKDYSLPARFWKLRRFAIGRGTPTYVSFALEIDGQIVESTNRGGWDHVARAEWEDEYHINSNESRQKPAFYILHGRNDFSFIEEGETIGVSVPARAEGFRLVPTPDRAYPIDIVYVPTAPQVEDELNFWNGWDEYVILDAGIKCRDKKQDDCSVLIEERNDYLKMVESAFIHRDLNEAPRVHMGASFVNEDWEEIGW